jgi:hypothetical protein
MGKGGRKEWIWKGHQIYSTTTSTRPRPVRVNEKKKKTGKNKETGKEMGDQRWVELSGNRGNYGHLIEP